MPRLEPRGGPVSSVTMRAITAGRQTARDVLRHARKTVSEAVHCAVVNPGGFVLNRSARHDVSLSAASGSAGALGLSGPRMV